MTDPAKPDRNARLVGAVRTLSKIGFVVCLAVVSVLSLLPGEEMPSLNVWDKLAHLVAYLVLAVLAGVGFPGASKLRALFWLLIAVGVLLEVAQAWVPGRYADAIDLVMNCAGVILGFLAVRFAARLAPQIAATNR